MQVVFHATCRTPAMGVPVSPDGTVMIEQAVERVQGVKKSRPGQRWLEGRGVDPPIGPSGGSATRPGSVSSNLGELERILAGGHADERNRRCRVQRGSRLRRTDRQPRESIPGKHLVQGKIRLLPGPTRSSRQLVLKLDAEGVEARAAVACASAVQTVEVEVWPDAGDLGLALVQP